MEDRNKEIKYILLLFAIFIVGVIVLRLFVLQVINGDFYEDVIKRQSESSISIILDRGKIVDGKGNVLVQSKILGYLYADGKYIENVTKIEKALNESNLTLTSKQKSAIINKRRFVYIARHINIQKAKNISSHNKYVYYGYEYGRTYPQGNLLKSVLGQTDVDNIGQGGVEGYFDEILKGKKIIVPIIRDSKSKRIMEKDTIKALSETSTVKLTVISQLQAFADYKLKNGIKKYDAYSGMALAIDVKTGEIFIFVSTICEQHK